MAGPITARGTFPTTAQIVAAISSIMPPALSGVAGTHDDASTEKLVIPPNRDHHLDIWGVLITGGDSSCDIELRSGNSDDGSSTPVLAPDGVAEMTVAHRLGAGATLALAPGSRPLWRTAANSSLVLKKDALDGVVHYQIWYRWIAD